MKIIKIDVDGVLRDLLVQMCNVYNEHYGESLSPDDVVHFDTEKIFTKCLEIDNMHPSEWLFQNHCFRLFYESPTLYKAKEAMDILHEKGYYIVIVTNQEYLYNKTDTLMWLDNNNIYYDSIIFTSKKDLINGDIVVDDHVWIGMRSMVLKNTIIGKNCIVGAASVCNKEYGKDNCLIAGNPAKIVKENVNWSRDKL